MAAGALVASAWADTAAVAVAGDDAEVGTATTGGERCPVDKKKEKKALKVEPPKEGGAN